MGKRKTSGKRFFGKGLPKVHPEQLNGKLIVIEGSDGSGRSTQISLLADWFEKNGLPTVVVGLKRSELVSQELETAMAGNTLGPITMGLFYATDFCDQLEHKIIPALRAGFIVLADRYIYTLIARDMVRGIPQEWLIDLYSFALVPDAVFYLKVSPENLALRNFKKNGRLDYWESGMDLFFPDSMYKCFLRYQKKLLRVFQQLHNQYNFYIIDGNRTIMEVNQEIKGKLNAFLKG